MMYLRVIACQVSVDFWDTTMIALYSATAATTVALPTDVTVILILHRFVGYRGQKAGVDLRSGHLCIGRRCPCHMVLGGPWWKSIKNCITAAQTGFLLLQTFHWLTRPSSLNSPLPKGVLLFARCNDSDFQGAGVRGGGKVVVHVSRRLARAVSTTTTRRNKRLV